MTSTKTRFIACALFFVPLLATGCGHAPSTAASSTEGVVAYAPHFLAATGGAVGTLVDGRLYAKGSEPTITATPAPAAPSAGDGHLHVTVSLAGVTDFVGGIKLRLRRPADADTVADVASVTIGSTHFIGESTETSLLNVPAGDYTLVKDTLSTTGGIFDETNTSAVVVVGKVSESKI